MFHVPNNLDPAGVARLMCACITTYAPLMHWKGGPGQRVGIVGLGGLGHMALKIAHALGAHLALFTTSPNKAEDARRLGVAVEAVPAFCNALLRYVAEHPAPKNTQPLHDADPELSAATPSFYAQLRAMEPFGTGNPVPVFRVHAASVHPRTEKFVTVRQGTHELKARASEGVGTEELGTALIALNGSGATLVSFVPNARKH